MKLKSTTFKFLKDIKNNNNRAWFNENKESFSAANKDFSGFVEMIISKIAIFDKSVINLNAKDCIFRIYRDVRFSKDKTPYKSNFGAAIVSGGRNSYLPGYYLHISDDGSAMVAGGLWRIEKDNLNQIRNSIIRNPAIIKKIINSSSFKKHFTMLDGEKLKSAPRGIDKNHPQIELLKYKSYIVKKDIPAVTVKSDAFAKEIITVCKAIKPLDDYLKKAMFNK